MSIENFPLNLSRTVSKIITFLRDAKSGKQCTCYYHYYYYYYYYNPLVSIISLYMVKLHTKSSMFFKFLPSFYYHTSWLSTFSLLHTNPVCCSSSFHHSITTPPNTLNLLFLYYTRHGAASLPSSHPPCCHSNINSFSHCSTVLIFT